MAEKFVQDVAVQAFVKITEVEQMEVVVDVTNTDLVGNQRIAPGRECGR